MEFESRDEKNSSYCESMIKSATLAFRFIFLSSMKTRKERATKGKKIITIKLNSRMGQKNSFCCELMIKWRRYVCNVRDAHFYASTFLFLSLFLSLFVSVRVSLLLFVRRCGGEKEAFIVLSVRYWNTRGMIVRGESGTSGWKIESRLARRLFLPCRLITSSKHPSRGESVKNARDEIFLSIFFFFFCSFHSLFPPPFFSLFPFLWLGCESKRAFFHDCEESLKKLFFAGIPCSRFESREAWTLLPSLFPKRRKFNKRIATNCSSAIQ